MRHSYYSCIIIMYILSIFAYNDYCIDLLRDNFAHRADHLRFTFRKTQTPQMIKVPTYLPYINFYPTRSYSKCLGRVPSKSHQSQFVSRLANQACSRFSNSM